MIAIATTNYDWFRYLREKQFSTVNFWTPTPWNIRGLNYGARFYFMLKHPIRKIGGYGKFVNYKNLKIEEAWKMFGYRNLP